ncbi:hypothetical protein Y032_0748g2026 [Ancylostoma ceylanicum]|uniref:Uncharacterized protein n=1 Tax=Ancylostoma ceylanicum TaxID=53326 RepID=A0A016WFK6_9BILA|nr:hypothetical protein Y032_0748g2026 [Ancylostoma ceylanicum]
MLRSPKVQTFVVLRGNLDVEGATERATQGNEYEVESFIGDDIRLENIFILSPPASVIASVVRHEAGARAVSPRVTETTADWHSPAPLSLESMKSENMWCLGKECKRN